MQFEECDYPHLKMPVLLLLLFLQRPTDQICRCSGRCRKIKLSAAGKANSTVLITADICHAHGLFAAVHAGNDFFSCCFHVLHLSGCQHKLKINDS